MKKYTFTSIFGIVGILTWTLTIFLRGLLLNNTCINFILGIMPNISATWFFIWLGEILINRKNIDFNFKIASITSGLVLILAIISEIIHDMFLGSLFDINDISATIISILIYLMLFYFSNTFNTKEQN